MLSPRVWLERFPFQLRLFVAFLVVLSFVAPTWHVCSLGGHIADMRHTTAMPAMQHEKVFQKSSSGALICFCAPTHRNEKFPVAAKMVLNGHMIHDASCLALLLSAMPALSVSLFRNLPTTQVAFRHWTPVQRDFPSRELIRTFVGRGPPC